MKVTKENAKGLAEELKRYLGEMRHGSTCDINIVEYAEETSIEVAPNKENITGGIYHSVEIVDFCRGRRLHHWIGARMVDGNPEPFIHIF